MLDTSCYDGEGRRPRLQRTGIFLSTLAAELPDGAASEEAIRRYASCFLVLLAVHDVKASDDVETVRVVPQAGAGDGARIERSISKIERAAQLVTPVGVADMVVFPMRRRETSLHDVVEIGRLDVNDVVIHHPSVAGFHAVLHRGVDGEYSRVVDRRTAGGTFVDTERVAPEGEGIGLRAGQHVRFGQVSMVFLDVRGVLDLVHSLRMVSARSTVAS